MRQLSVDWVCDKFVRARCATIFSGPGVRQLFPDQVCDNFFRAGCATSLSGPGVRQLSPGLVCDKLVRARCATIATSFSGPNVRSRRQICPSRFCQKFKLVRAVRASSLSRPGVQQPCPGQVCDKFSPGRVCDNFVQAGCATAEAPLSYKMIRGTSPPTRTKNCPDVRQRRLRSRTKLIRGASPATSKNMARVCDSGGSVVVQNWSAETSCLNRAQRKTRSVDFRCYYDSRGPRTHEWTPKASRKRMIYTHF